MSDARDEILGRIRSALGDTPVPPDGRTRLPRGRRRPRRRGLFCERVADYRATVHRVPSGGLADALADACRERGAARLAVPSEAPAELAGVEFVRDEPPFRRETSTPSTAC